MKRGKESCELAVHLNSSPHSLDQIHFIMIEQIHKNSNIEEVLTNREAYWTAQLKSFHPHGLNKRKEFNSYKRTKFNATSLKPMELWSFI